MRYFTLLLFFLVCFTGLKAQVQYGTLDYTRSVEREMEVQGMEENKELKAMLAKMAASGAFTENYRATFNPDGFTFVEVPKEATTMESEMGGGMVVMIQTGGEEPSQYSTNLKKGEVLNSEFILDKRFLISGKPEQLDWQLTGESIPPSDATVGLELKVATAITKAGDTITAGYAPSLPVQVGPQNYYGLPGAIITLSIPQKDGGEVVFRATSMSISQEPLPLVLPTEGKKISLEKFRSEQKKRSKTMTRTIMH